MRSGNLPEKRNCMLGEGVAEGHWVECLAESLKNLQEVEVQVPWKAGVRETKTESIFEKSIRRPCDPQLRSPSIAVTELPLLTLCWTRQDSFCLRVGMGFPRKAGSPCTLSLEAPYPHPPSAPCTRLTFSGQDLKMLTLGRFPWKSYLNPLLWSLSVTGHPTQEPLHELFITTVNYEHRATGISKFLWNAPRIEKWLRTKAPKPQRK